MEERFEEYLRDLDLPTSYAGDLLDTWEDRKKELFHILGLNARNDYRQFLEGVKVESEESQAPEYRNYMEAARFVCKFTEWFLDMDLTSDSKGSMLVSGKIAFRCAAVYNHRSRTYSDPSASDIEKCKQLEGVKLSKWLNRKDVAPYFKEWLRHEHRDSPVFTCLNNGGSRKVDQKSFLPTFFELIKEKKQNIKLMVTGNPMDFIGVNVDASYTSCLSPGGEYFNGTTSYMRDTFTVLCVVVKMDKTGKKIEKKIGRSWLYVKWEEDCIIQAKSYGTFTDTDRKAVREWTQSRITGSTDSTPTTFEAGLFASAGVWKARSDSFPYNNNGGGYIDGSSATITRFDRYTEKGVVCKLDFEESFCLECGVLTSHSTNGVCFECDNQSICYNCGCHADEDTMYYDGKHSSQ